MYRIWKYPLAIVDKQTLRFPGNFKVLSVGLDPQDQLCLWALVEQEPSAIPTVEYDRTVYVIGTGNPMPEDVYFFYQLTQPAKFSGVKSAAFLGTVRSGPAMWHVFIGE